MKPSDRIMAIFSKRVKAILRDLDDMSLPNKAKQDSTLITLGIMAQSITDFLDEAFSDKGIVIDNQVWKFQPVGYSKHIISQPTTPPPGQAWDICPSCKLKMQQQAAPCPSNMPGCCVYHFDYVCINPLCPSKNHNMTKES